jgi:DNA-binding MarR family transcriptional regulator
MKTHNMDKQRLSEADQHKALQILHELSGNNSLTQRDISSRLGVALGLVNSYLKNLIAKGYVTVKSIPPRRYAYYLTPKGFAEKTRLSFDLLHDYTRIYREARKNLKELFTTLGDEGVRRVVFAGADEVAEIAYLTLHETRLELAGVLDDDLAGKQFFGRRIGRISDLGAMRCDRIVVVSYLKREKIYKALLEQRALKSEINVIFPV